LSRDYASRIVLALALAAALAGCASTSASQGLARAVTVGEVISGQSFDRAEQVAVTGRLYRGAPRSIYLVDPAYELSEYRRVPWFEECLQVATTASQSKSLKRYDGQIITLVGSIASIPISSDRITITTTLRGKQQIHLYCQYPFDGGVVPIIDLASWKRP
jgi:hypothetical protein